MIIMNILTVLLQASATTGAAAGAAKGNAGGMGGGATFWIFIILMFVIMWFFMIRPQNKQRKELEQFRNALQKGDKVVTAGGIYGVVEEIKDKTVLIKVDGDVKLKVDKNSLVRDYTQDTPQQ